MMAALVHLHSMLLPEDDKMSCFDGLKISRMLQRNSNTRRFSIPV